MQGDLIGDLKAAIADVFDAYEKYFRVKYNDTARQQLGQPADERQLQELQAKQRGPFPPSYVAFLRLHDGWRCFSGDADVLSITQRESPEIRAHLAEFRSLLSEDADAPAREGFVIVGGPASTYFVYIDWRTRDENGECNFVEYGYHEGEIARHKSLVGFLHSRRDSLRRLIARETGAAA